MPTLGSYTEGPSLTPRNRFFSSCASRSSRNWSRIAEMNEDNPASLKSGQDVNASGATDFFVSHDATMSLACVWSKISLIVPQISRILRPSRRRCSISETDFPMRWSALKKFLYFCSSVNTVHPYSQILSFGSSNSSSTLNPWTLSARKARMVGMTWTNDKTAESDAHAPLWACSDLQGFPQCPQLKGTSTLESASKVTLVWHLRHLREMAFTSSRPTIILCSITIGHLTGAHPKLVSYGFQGVSEV